MNSRFGTVLKPCARLSGLVKMQCRQININKLSNKRITRLESDIELTDSEFKSRLINRNPRNLEQLSFEKKPTGFWLEKSPPNAWNKLKFVQEDNYLCAYLEHWSGRRLISATTKEPQLSKYFVSPNTTQAAKILAQVISRRCLQSGYLYAAVDEVSDDDKGVKMMAFYESVKSSGISLEEPPEIVTRTVTDM